MRKSARWGLGKSGRACTCTHARGHTPDRGRHYAQAHPGRPQSRSICTHTHKKHTHTHTHRDTYTQNKLNHNTLISENIAPSKIEQIVSFTVFFLIQINTTHFDGRLDLSFRSRPHRNVFRWKGNRHFVVVTLLPSRQ